MASKIEFIKVNKIVIRETGMMYRHFMFICFVMIHICLIDNLEIVWGYMIK